MGKYVKNRINLLIVLELINEIIRILLFFGLMLKDREKKGEKFNQLILLLFMGDNNQIRSEKKGGGN